jgi:hypothetical protein
MVSDLGSAGGRNLCKGAEVIRTLQSDAPPSARISSSGAHSETWAAEPDYEILLDGPC